MVLFKIIDEKYFLIVECNEYFIRFLKLECIRVEGLVVVVLLVVEVVLSKLLIVVGSLLWKVKIVWVFELSLFFLKLLSRLYFVEFVNWEFIVLISVLEKMLFICFLVCLFWVLIVLLLVVSVDNNFVELLVDMCKGFLVVV